LVALSIGALREHRHGRRKRLAESSLLNIRSSYSSQLLKKQIAFPDD
jgi:hypothetical protein